MHRSSSRLFASVVLALAAPAAASVPLQNSWIGSAGAGSSAVATVSVGAPGATASSPTGALPITPRFEPFVAGFFEPDAILAGGRLTISGNVAVTSQVNASVGAGGAGRTASGNAVIEGAFDVAGLRFATGALSADSSCAAANCGLDPSRNRGTTRGDFSVTRTLSGDALAAFYQANVPIALSGRGTVSVAAGAGAASATAGGFVTLGGVGGAAQYQVDYDYLRHARPSFAADGDVQVFDWDLVLPWGSGTISQAVPLRNLGDINSAGLRLDSIARETNDSRFLLDLVGLTTVAPGETTDVVLSFAPGAPGLARERFTLTLSDDVPGGVGVRSYQMIINASAQLAAPPSVVPEPATWAMMIAGFGLVGAAARARRRGVA